MKTPPPVSESKAQAAALGAVFLLSGVVALLYEAAWQRQFTLLFGSAAPATAAVLAAYFGGLGLGSWLLGKWGARRRHPLRTYAALEVTIAAGALLVAPVLSLYARFYPDLFERGQGQPFLLFAAKMLLAFAAIVLPAAAMGGTLPVLAQLFEKQRDRLGELAGRLYMLNTAGAALGMLLFPWLLRMTGMRQCIWICAGVNLLLAIVAFLMPLPSVRETGLVAKPEKPATGTKFRRWLALAFASGFITFALQVGWSRLFAQTHENSIWSFSIVVAFFIAAIAAGAGIARYALRRPNTNPATTFLGMWMIGGMLTLTMIVSFPLHSQNLHYREGISPLLWPAFRCIFIPVMFLAAGLPLILQRAVSLTSRSAGELTGIVFAWNVAGSVAGALSAGFILPFTAGMWGTLYIPAATALICAVLAVPGQIPPRGLVFIGVLTVGSVYTCFRPRVRLETSENEKLLALQEGAYGVVAVVERPGSRKLKLNNHYGLGGSASAGDERMQAHIPLLVHPDPLRKLFLGYGTGITAGTVFYHRSPAPPLSGGNPDVTAVELVPEAAVLSNSYFPDANNRFPEQPGARLIIEDARNFLRGTAKQYDVIVGDLVVPWRQGEGALYTLEHFQAARARLAPGGLYCAWLPLFQLGEEDLHCILRTFVEVFPQTTVWRGDFSPREPALALIGFASNGTGFDPAVPARRKLLQPDPLNPQLAYPKALWMHYIGAVTPAEAGDFPLNTEDCPRVELRTSRPPPFTGRKFQAWEDGLRRASKNATLPVEAQSGMEAGRLMEEFTLLLIEGRTQEAGKVQAEVVKLIGHETARCIFGD